jgi:NTE family protein
MPKNLRGVSAVSLMLCVLAAGQPRPEERGRPKIGLALSGGSALGLAHVGVIRWLEEHRIPVDYVAGTSMGALVGAVYATGHEAGEMERFLSQVDWQEALAAGVDFRQLAFRRKEDVREFPSTVEFGLKKGLRLPPGLSAGHGVGLVVSRIAAPYGDLRRFDDLPTPFRCVATDLNSAREVVFGDGPLFDALRASMSLPGLFAPVQKDGMLLVDGGLLNNIPVEVVRKMGADIVIAVALEKPAEDGRYTSLLGVAGRSIAVMITANERLSLGQADVVIMPNLNGLGATDYPKWKEFEARGEAAAQAKARVLEPFALPEDDYRAYVRARQARRRPEEVKPQFIEVDGDMVPRRKAALVAALSANPAKPLPRDELELELTKIAGLGRFDAVSYSYVERNGKQGVVVSPHAKDYGPPFLKVSFLLDASRQEGFRFGVGMRLTMLDVVAPASEWRTDLSIGQINRASTEYYYRIQGGKFFLAPRLFYLEDSRPLYRGDTQISDFITRQTGGAMDLGYSFGRFQELRVGYALKHERIAITKGVNASEELAGRSGDLHVRWAYEGQDSALVPRRGVRATLHGAWLLDYPQVQGTKPLGESTISYARPLAGRYSLLADGAGGWTSAELPLYSRFALGGVGRLDTLGRGRLFGNRYYYGGARLLRSLTSDSLGLFGRFYVFAAAEAGRAWYPGISALPRYSGSMGLMGETAFGVVYLGAGAGDQGDRRLFFRLGRVF